MTLAQMLKIKCCLLSFTLLAVDAGVAHARSTTVSSSQKSQLASTTQIVPEQSRMIVAETGQNTSQVVVIGLSELIDLTLAGNRTLRDEKLQRIVQRQQLNEAEQIFEPRITPGVSVDVAQSFSTERLGDDRVEASAGVTTTLSTRLGTELSVGIDTISDSQPFSFSVRQPLLRGFGTEVNEAPVEQARLTESVNELALRQTVIDTITFATNQYTALIQAQEQVEIQELALGRRQQELERLQALVDFGRRAPVDLFDSERSVADAERDLIIAQNQLTQANTALLNLVGTDQSLQFVAASETIRTLFESAEDRVTNLEGERLIETAYQIRPDYLQAQLALEINQYDQLIAEDNQRWQLDVVGDGNLGDVSRSTVGLALSRTFGEESLDTEKISSDVNIERSENRIAQLQETIRNDVITRLSDVNSNLSRVEAARRATENAIRQLEVSREQFRRGTVTNFEVTSQEQTLVDAQNAQLLAEIAFLNSIADLDQTVGTTIDVWSGQVDIEQVFENLDIANEPASP